MRKQSRLRTIFAVTALTMLVVAGGASLTSFTARRTAWRLSHSTYARVARFRYRTVARTVVSAGAAASGDVWQRLRACESGGNYARNSGNGYYGAYQFSASTWHGLGFSGLPHQADPATQDQAAQKLLARSGWGQWPACSRAIGAR